MSDDTRRRSWRCRIEPDDRTVIEPSDDFKSICLHTRQPEEWLDVTECFHDPCQVREMIEHLTALADAIESKAPHMGLQDLERRERDRLRAERRASSEEVAGLSSACSVLRAKLAATESASLDEAAGPLDRADLRTVIKGCLSDFPPGHACYEAAARLRDLLGGEG